MDNIATLAVIIVAALFFAGGGPLIIQLALTSYFYNQRHRHDAPLVAPNERALVMQRPDWRA